MKQMGYLFLDHSNSPGLPEDIARKAGYDPKLVGEGKVFEADTVSCIHCKTSVIKNPDRTRERYFCQKCSGHYICDGCEWQSRQPGYSHTPFEKLFEYELIPIFGPTGHILSAVKKDSNNG
jgi:hypothetical protein